MIESCERRVLLSRNIVDFGAKTEAQDPTFDNAAAINAALNMAKNDTVKQVTVPSGVFRYGAIIDIPAGVELTGTVAYGGTSSRHTLKSTNAAASNIRLKGAGGIVRNLYLVGNKTAGRSQSDDSVMIRAAGASNYTIDHVEVDGGAGAGIKSDNGATGGIIDFNNVHNTKADGIHNVHGSNNIKIRNNTVKDVGDDPIAVVSYDSTQSTYVACGFIEISHNTCDNANGVDGRGITVVGGHDVQITNNIVRNTKNSGIYITTEDSYHTLAINNVTVTGNTVTNANTKGTGSHAGIMIKGRNSSLKTTNITIGGTGALGNTVTNSTGQGVNIGGFTENIKILGNTIDTTTKDGVQVASAKNVQINNNIIKKTKNMGVHFQSGCSGACTINDNDFLDINTSGTTTPLQYVVWIESTAPKSTFTSLQIMNNDYQEDGNYDVAAYIRSAGFTATVSGNTTDTGETNQL